MKKSQWLVVIYMGLFTVFVYCQSTWAGDFTLKSQQLKDGGTMAEAHVLNGFGCAGKNISPELSWQNPPAGTKSFAVTVYDPDAPTGSGWWHWVIFNIHTTVRKLSANSGNDDFAAAPKGSIQSMTDFGKSGYGGACPPKGHGPHRYIFTVFALDVESLALDATATAAMVGYYLNQHALAKAC